MGEALCALLARSDGNDVNLVRFHKAVEVAPTISTVATHDTRPRSCRSPPGVDRTLRVDQ